MNLNVLLLLVVFLSHLPMTLALLDRMWGSGHYQYFPVAILVILWLIWDRIESSDAKRQEESPRLIASGFALLLPLLFLAVIFQSMMLTAFSLFFVSGWFLFAFLGRGLFWQVLPAWLLGLLVIPLPAGLDDRMVLSLQFVSSQLASLMLDGVGQLHFRQGVILMTENNQFLTEEACSGIRSLFSSIAAIAMLGVYRRYSIWRHFVNFVQVVFWVIVGNGIRVATVVFVADNYTQAIATGWAHDALGLVVFIFIFGMALSTDSLVNLLCAALGKGVRSGFLSSDEHHRSSTWGFIRESLSASASVVGPKRVWPIAIAFFFVGLASARLQFVAAASQVATGVKGLPVSAEADVPRELVGWRMVNFEHIYRGENQLEAADSYVWRFEKAGVIATLSIDSPWNYWHDLTNCYRGLGWQTDTDHLYADIETLFSRENLPNGDGYSVINMSKPSGAMGVVYFSSFDRASVLLRPTIGTSLYSVDLLWQKVVANTSRVFGVDMQRARRFDSGSLPVSTIQLVATSSGAVDASVRDDLAALFFEARKYLLSTPRFDSL